MEDLGRGNNSWRMKDKESEDLVWDLDSKLPGSSTISSYISKNIRPSSYKLFAEFQSIKFSYSITLLIGEGDQLIFLISGSSV